MTDFAHIFKTKLDQKNGGKETIQELFLKKSLPTLHNTMTTKKKTNVTTNISFSSAYFQMQSK